MKTVAKRRGRKAYKPMEFMEIVEKLLGERGILQAELSRTTGISEPQFSHWKDQAEKRKAGKIVRGGPNLKQGVLIAKALGIPPEALVYPETAHERLVLTEHERTIFEVYRSLGSPDHQKVIRAISAIAEAEKHEPIVGRRTETPGKGRSRLPGGDQNG